ncbi:Hsp20/alpha crystallin family protein [Urechidicola vernalis]|uniref:Hsp20/alpha crystallin family protein n=1 Tax=Urechidicola vernalis TaxID=3075600 RepID=A0ABU2Y511_9FLAO|nr:Hsp20/alpha crystallin family protein [Urechidicola sp. P050]MDT0552148.1 Hsp20/alpha crystallin family protein [Urechidicola sp. P050]
MCAPGYSKEEFKISIENNVLNVQGEKTSEKEEAEENFTRKEFSFNSFNRALKLPTSVNTDALPTANYSNGILKLLVLKHTDLAKKQQKQFIEIE